MPRLFVLSGDDIGRTHDVRGAAVIGRGQDADVVLRAPSVSRKHARLEPSEGGWRVVDLDSSNGLVHGGRRVAEARLADGDVFALGDIELRFRDDEAGATTPPAAFGAESAGGGAGPAFGAVRAEDAARWEASATSRAPEAPRLHPRDETRDATRDAIGDATRDAIGESTRDAARTEPRSGRDVGGAGDAPAEIELEGDWEDVEAPPEPTRRRPLAPPPAAPAIRPAGSIGADARRDRRAEALGTVRARMAQPPAAPAGGSTQRVLQYHRVSGAGGLLGGDLAQRPLAMRLAIYAGAAVLFIGLAWGALELTRKLRADRAVLEDPIAGDAE